MKTKNVTIPQHGVLENDEKKRSNHHSLPYRSIITFCGGIYNSAITYYVPIEDDSHTWLAESVTVLNNRERHHKVSLAARLTVFEKSDFMIGLAYKETTMCQPPTSQEVHLELSWAPFTDMI